MVIQKIINNPYNNIILATFTHHDCAYLSEIVHITSVSDSNRVSNDVAVSRKTKKKNNRFRKLQNYQTKLGVVTCFISANNKLLMCFGFKFMLLNLWRIYV